MTRADIVRAATVVGIFTMVAIDWLGVAVLVVALVNHA